MVLAFIAVLSTVTLAVGASPEHPAKYDRSLFRQWTDPDGNGLNARQDALIRHGRNIKMDKSNRHVISGVWLDYYSGDLIFNLKEVDIDHVVPLEEAYNSGASEWSSPMRERFANDQDNLLPVSGHYNRQKGSKDIARWLPVDRKYRCTYIHQWLAIKDKYNLEVDPKERKVVASYEPACSLY